ncbi:hypothetical protein ES703_10014 [subsurface metagenome]
MNPTNNNIELLSPTPPDGWAAHGGNYVAVKDKETGFVYIGNIRLYRVYSTKSESSKSPYEIHIYAQFRKDNQPREKYLGSETPSVNEQK